MTGTPKKIVIVGGGIGGLAAALSLLKRGLDVEVYEQAPELKEVGAGIQISSNGTRVLYALGLEDALKRFQVLPSRISGIDVEGVGFSIWMRPPRKSGSAAAPPL